ncbi:unnamed protein product, partial [Nesidiocoris tenuis]
AARRFRSEFTLLEISLFSGLFYNGSTKRTRRSPILPRKPLFLAGFHSEKKGKIAIIWRTPSSKCIMH